METNESRYIVLALLLANLIGMFGCQTQHQIIRKQIAPCQVTTPVSKDDPCKASSTEKYIEKSAQSDVPYSVSFVEFDDQGMAWDPDQLESLLNYLKARKDDDSSPGTVVMVFVHGWKHNAEFCDPNVACFRELVRTAALAEQKLLKREVVGVYIGWHGRSLNAASDLSFFARKRVAERVAQGQIRELFSRLLTMQANAVNEPKNIHRMRLMFMGHSFGGLITYEALAPYLLDDAFRRKDSKEKRKRFADLVLLINPAFEATQYYPLHLVSTTAPPENQGKVPCPVFVSLTSDNDYATKRWFPAGRRLATFFENFKDAQEHEMAVHTIGHWDKFKTHRLQTITKVTDAQPSIEAGKGGCSCQAWQLNAEDSINSSGSLFSEAQDDGRRRKYRNTMLTPLTNAPPTTHWVVQTDPPVIDGHNNFFTEQVKDFILLLYNDIVIGERNGTCQR
jgi:hypothetical protein